MLNSNQSTLHQKEATVIAILKAFIPAISLDYDYFEAVEALKKTLLVIEQYPGLHEIKMYPLGRNIHDKNILAARQNICICLSGNAPNGTIEMIHEHLLQALESIQQKINEYTSPY